MKHEEISTFDGTESVSTERLRSLFDVLDYDKNDVIDATDLFNLHKVMNIRPWTEQTVIGMIQTADLNGSQDVDFGEFVILMEKMNPINEELKVESVLEGWAANLSIARYVHNIVGTIPALNPRLGTRWQQESETTTVVTPLESEIVQQETKPVIQKYVPSFWDDYIKVGKHLTAGGVAGAVSRTTVSPLERMKILFQIQGPGAPKYQGVIPTLIKISKEEGIKGYFKGNGTNIIRIVPYSAIQFASYERYKKFLLNPGEKDLDTIRRLTAGAMAGITSVACTYPLDLVRTRLSVQKDNIRYHGVIHCTKLIYKEEGGVVALFRGLSPTILGIAPYVALNFTVYETLRSWFKDRYGEPSVVQKLFCGAVAGSVAQTATYPLDLIRRRMQMVGMKEIGYKYKGTWSAILTIATQEGIKGLYKGMLPNLLKVAPAISVSFVTYEAMKKLLAAT